MGEGREAVGNPDRELADGGSMPSRSCAHLVRILLSGKRDRAILAVLIGCGLRRAELVGLQADDLQIREEHWVCGRSDREGHAHPNGSGAGVGSNGRWMHWTQAAGITTGFIFRAVEQKRRALGGPPHPQSHMARGERGGPGDVGIAHLAPSRPPPEVCARLCHLAGGELEQIQFLLGHVSVQTTERYLGCKQKTAERGERRNRSGGRVIGGPSGPPTGLRGILKGRSPGSQWSQVRHGCAMSLDAKIEQQRRICLLIWQRPSIDHDMARISRIYEAQR
jgi:hypothetical protein